MNDEAWTIAGLDTALRSGATTSVRLVRELLTRADAYDPTLGVYLSRFDAEALASASAADAERAAGRDRGPLHGIPVGIKDVFTTGEGPTTAQSLTKHGWRDDRRDASVITRLREAGAVLLGKVSTMEFGVGGPVGHTAFRVPRNPWNTDHWTGGSSSGTASGIASGLFPAGLGSDTAGSIRGPAGFCGISGLKTTFGLLPTTGCIPLAPSFDTIGPMARTAWDCALLLDALTGTGHHTEPTADLYGLRVGVDPSPAGAAVADPAVLAGLSVAVEVLRAAGATVHRVGVPWYEELTTATVLGFVTEGFAEHRDILRRQWSACAPQTRLALATGALLNGGDYARIQRVRQIGREAIDELFGRVDLLVTPTAAGAAPRVADLPALRTIDALYTPAWNATGHPALSVPMGFTDSGLPVGLQIVGRHREEKTILAAGHAFQLRTDWHLRTPPMPTAMAPPGAHPRPRLVTEPLSNSPVPAFLEAAGLTPPPEDRHVLVDRYPELAARIEVLYRGTPGGE